MAKILTKAQQEALDKIQQRGGGWFKPYDLPHIIRRPDYTCRTLKAKGYLESRTTDTLGEPEYRLKP